MAEAPIPFRLEGTDLTSLISGCYMQSISLMENTGPAKINDNELVGLAKTGDREAFEMLVERYKQKAYQIAFHHSRDREEAKDLSQEAFLRAYTQLKGFDLRSSFYTWFYRILGNLCIDYKRRNRRFTLQPLEAEDNQQGAARNTSDHSASPDEEVSAGQMARRVEVTLSGLPANQRTAFFLKNQEGLSIREISKIMRAAEGTIKVHLHRAVTALRRNLVEFE